MKAKFLILCLPLLGGCGGFVELGPVDHDQGEPSSSTSVEFEHTLIQFAPWRQGMCALFSDEQIRCWTWDEDSAHTLPNLTGVGIHGEPQSRPSRLCALQSSGRVACIMDTRGDRYADVGYAEAHELIGIEGATRLTEGTPGFAVLGDGRVQPLHESTCSPCPEADEPIVDVSAYGDFATASGSAFSTRIHHMPAVIDRIIVPNDSVMDFSTLPALRVPEIDDALEIDGDHVLHRSGKVTAFAWIPCAGPGTAVAFQGSARVECLDGAVTLKSNGSGTCALRTDGSLWCWGFSMVGELGVIERVPSSYPPLYADYSVVLDTPYQLPTVAGVRDFGMGGGITCVVRGKNEVSCWGWRGMTAEPTTIPRPIRFQ